MAMAMAETTVATAAQTATTAVTTRPTTPARTPVTPTGTATTAATLTITLAATPGTPAETATTTAATPTITAPAVAAATAAALTTRAPTGPTLTGPARPPGAGSLASWWPMPPAPGRCRPTAGPRAVAGKPRQPGRSQRHGAIRCRRTITPAKGTRSHPAGPPRPWWPGSCRTLIIRPPR